MVDQYTAPIDHTAGSALASTATGAAGGALEGGFKGFLGGIKKLALVGGAVGLVLATFGTGLIALPAAGAVGVVLPGIVGQLGAIAGWTAFGTAIGGLLGVVAGYITVPVGSVLGAFKGGSRAASEVSEQRGAAAAVQSQIELARAQAPIMAASSPSTVITVPSVYMGREAQAPNRLLEEGPMNQASPMLAAGNDNRVYEGALAGQQRAASL